MIMQWQVPYQYFISGGCFSKKNIGRVIMMPLMLCELPAREATRDRFAAPVS